MGAVQKAGLAVAGAAVAAAITWDVSDRVVQMVAQHESVVHVAYADPYYGWKLPTICYGHTKGVKRGDTATQEVCEAWLKEDLDEAVGKLKKALAPYNVSLTQGEIDAYTSFIYNLGRFTNTPSVMGRLIKGDRIGACQGLLLYTYSNGIYSKGLANRREVEYRVCISEIAPAPDRE